MLPVLRLASNSRIVNISSICGLVSFPFVGPYCASKHAIEALTMALRGELRPFGIQVTTVAPGLVNTPLWNQIESEVTSQLTSYSDQQRAWYADRMSRRLQRTVKMARSGLAADAVAMTVLRAVKQPRLQARYLVGRDARLAYLADRLLPRHAWLQWLRHRCGLPV
jgi:NAD(P)-dependent dehydrogenase (short-subunit alcohol dehydrogenase family)